MKVLTKELKKSVDFEKNQNFYSNMCNFNGLNLGDLLLGSLLKYE